MTRTSWRDLTTARASFALVTLGVLGTYLSIMTMGGDVRTWPDAATIAGQLLLPAALGSAIVLCLACRLYPRDGVPWLAAATTIVGVQSFPTLVATDSDSPLAGPAPISSAIALGLALLLVVRASQARLTLRSPIPAGVAIGLAVILFRGLWSLVPTSPVADLLGRPFQLDSTELAQAVGGALLLGVGIVLALAVARQTPLPQGHRRVVLAAALWPIPEALGIWGLTEQPGWSVAAVVAGLATCVLLLSASLDLLWQAVRDDQAAVRHLQRQLLTLRDRAREGIEQLHEVKGSIAGIASATDLIQHEDRLTLQHRKRLEELLVSETARLQRLLHTHAPDLPSETADLQPDPDLDLDDILRPLVLARRIQGQEVSWDAPAFPVRGHGDDLAEAVNILLQNAAEHAPGAAVRIFTRGGGAELVVADNGPGIPAGLEERVFGWGYSRPGSTGQGVGLAMARRLLEQHGRTLRLETEHHPGAAFVIGLELHSTEGSRGDASALAG